MFGRRMMVDKHNGFTNTRGGQDNPPTTAYPFVNVQGAMVRVHAAIWSSSQQAYWVHYDEHTRGWVSKADLYWQHVLEFPET